MISLNYQISAQLQNKAMHLHFECQCLSANSWTHPLDEAVIASALPRMMATEIC